MANSAVKGPTVRFYVNTGTYGSPSYTAWGGARTSSLSTDVDTVDKTDKDSGDAKENISIRYGWNISFSGLFDAGDTATEQIEADIIGLTLAKVQFKTINSRVYSGEGYYTNWTINSPFDNIVDNSGTFQGTGALSIA